MTSFQHKCFETLVQCDPWGSAISYARIADLIRHSNAYRAVGTAMNKNVNAPEVPCHRVVKSNGELVPYAFSSILKQKRLHEEGVKVFNNKIVDLKKSVFKVFYLAFLKSSVIEPLTLPVQPE